MLAINRWTRRRRRSCWRRPGAASRRCSSTASGRSDMPEEGCIYVGAPAEQSGALAGELMADYFRQNPAADRNGDGVIQYALLRGSPGTRTRRSARSISQDRFGTRGWRSRWSRRSGQLAAGEAKSIMTEWLAAYDGSSGVRQQRRHGAGRHRRAEGPPGLFRREIPAGVASTRPRRGSSRCGRRAAGHVLNDAISQGGGVSTFAGAGARGSPRGKRGLPDHRRQVHLDPVCESDAQTLTPTAAGHNDI